MIKTVEPILDARGLRFAIVVGRFNEHLTSRLLEGAKQTLIKAGALENDITVIFVPGAFEVPLATKKLALTKKYDAIVTLGCVLRGGTHHFDYVCREVAHGIQQVILETEVPITLGILMADSADQAVERSGGRFGNRGEEAARAAIEMATLKI